MTTSLFVDNFRIADHRPGTTASAGGPACYGYSRWAVCLPSDGRV